MCLINITCDFSKLDFSSVSRSVNTITIAQSTHTYYSLFQTCACISLVIGRFKTTAWCESIYFLHFICHFKNMATTSTICHHSRAWPGCHSFATVLRATLKNDTTQSPSCLAPNSHSSKLFLILIFPISSCLLE